MNSKHTFPSAMLVLSITASLWAKPYCVWARQDINAMPLIGSWKTEQAAQEAVARVNGEPVFRAQFERMVGNPLTLRQAQQELKVEKPDRKALERLAMQRLIHLQLLLQEAHRRGITVTQKELDETITALRQRFDDLNSFGAWIKDQGLDDPSLFDTVRSDMLAERVAADLGSAARVTDEEARQYFEKHREELIIGMEVRLRIIAVPDKSEAEEILTAAQKGAAFDSMARQRSRGKLASKGGDTGWVNFMTLPLSLRETIAKLKPKEIYGPVEKAAGEFLIIALQDRRPIRAESLAEVRTEIEQRILAAKRQEIMDVWLAEQEKKSKIELFLQPG